MRDLTEVEIQWVFGGIAPAVLIDLRDARKQATQFLAAVLEQTLWELPARLGRPTD